MRAAARRWRVRGRSHEGNACEIVVRADDYSEARRIALARKMHIEDVCLVEERPQ